MLDLNQRPPPCKLGWSFLGGYYPVEKCRLYKRFSTFLASSFSCSVRVRTAPVAARLQHLTLLRPAPSLPTLSGSGRGTPRSVVTGARDARVASGLNCNA